jgi:hypothetical protein
MRGCARTAIAAPNAQVHFSPAVKLLRQRLFTSRTRVGVLFRKLKPSEAVSKSGVCAGIGGRLRGRETGAQGANAAGKRDGSRGLLQAGCEREAVAAHAAAAAGVHSVVC